MLVNIANSVILVNKKYHKMLMLGGKPETLASPAGLAPYFSLQLARCCGPGR